MAASNPPMSPTGETQLVSAIRSAVAASLAGSIIAASGRPHSIKEALEVVNNVHHAMYPNAGSGRYQAWAEKKDEILNAVHE